jgi:Na+-transporting methylmalonyl-CoA/oxaloacetate decarboxylase gamma subunit
MNIATIILQAQVPVATHAAADAFKEMDPFGIGMTLIAMTVVFSVLAIIYLTFKYFSKLYSLDLKKVKTGTVATEKTIEKHDVSAEVGAAIAMAMHLYASQQHDLDSLTLTINSVSRRYSPWSSKIYTLRQLPR